MLDISCGIFSGRQNDIQGHGEINKGNWLSGIPFIDENIRGLGPQDIIPKNMANNKGRNNYYMLPFLLGLIGLIYQLKINNKDAFVVFLLFIFTGIAIVVYINQYPFQPRERLCIRWFFLCLCYLDWTWCSCRNRLSF